MKLGNKKGDGGGLELIGKAALVILILVILIFLVNKIPVMFKGSTDCESSGDNFG